MIKCRFGLRVSYLLAFLLLATEPLLVYADLAFANLLIYERNETMK